MKKLVCMVLLAVFGAAWGAAQRRVPTGFTVVKENAVTAVKNQHRSGTCWDFATLAFFESEILRKSGRAMDLCEMFVVNKDYMDCAEHYVRMHTFSQITEGGSADDVLDVLRKHGICPEGAMPAPGTLVGDSLANFTDFTPRLEHAIKEAVDSGAKHPAEGWRGRVQEIIDRYVGRCPEQFVYEGKVYTPLSFAAELGLDWGNYVSLTSFTHHPFDTWFVLEAPYKWRLKPSYNIPIDRLMDALEAAIRAGYCVAWGGDVSGGFTTRGMAELDDGCEPTQELRQEQFDDWTFTYDHVMLIYGLAEDKTGRRYYMVKNSWGTDVGYEGTWYMSADYMRLNTSYLFLNRHALPKALRKAVATGYF